MANVLSIVSYKILPAKLGGQKGIALFNEYFSKHHSLYCATIANNDAALAPYEVFNILSNHASRYVNFFYIFPLLKIIKERNISHVIIEHPYYGWLGYLLQTFSNVKIIIHSHNIESERFKTIGKWWWKLLWYYEKWTHRMADFTFCITPEDREYMFKNYKIAYERSMVITYGISWDTIPSVQERGAAKNSLRQQYKLSSNTHLFLFNGTLNYGPNLDAVNIILNKINPILLSTELDYRIIICGKGLPENMNNLESYTDKNIIYAGFVDDINIYFKGVDVFINPVIDGGGIKTKLVEALGFNLNAVSTINGAIGIDKNLCNEKLFLSNNDDWHAFTASMIDAITFDGSIQKEYFDHFYWNSIALKAADIIENKL